MPSRRFRFGEDVAELRRHLERGGVAAVATESSYGLAAAADSPPGVERIYALKERDRGKPLPVVIADREQALALGVEVDHPSFRWAQGLWPAPLTVVVPLRSRVRLAAAAGGETLAIRVPAHEKLRNLLREIGFALTATSANTSGRPPLCRVAEVERLVGDDEWIVDGGTLPGGLPSTVVTWRVGVGPQVLRQGAFEVLSPGKLAAGAVARERVFSNRRDLDR